MRNSFRHTVTFLGLVLILSNACQQTARVDQQSENRAVTPAKAVQQQKPLPDNAPPQLKQLIDGAVEQVGVTTGYDPAYVSLDYPGGDVAPDTGVCSDVVVRALRKAGIDLQKELHQDMKRAWSAYPRRWGTTRPDPNIDHRRVQNLMTYFERQRKTISITGRSEDYLPGDIVCWDLGNGVDHIGIVTTLWSDATNRYLIAHNIGAGARIEDVLFLRRITGHYRYFR